LAHVLVELDELEFIDDLRRCACSREQSEGGKNHAHHRFLRSQYAKCRCVVPAEVVARGSRTGAWSGRSAAPRSCLTDRQTPLLFTRSPPRSPPRGPPWAARDALRLSARESASVPAPPGRRPAPDAASRAP